MGNGDVAEAWKNIIKSSHVYCLELLAFHIFFLLFVCLRKAFKGFLCCSARSFKIFSVAFLYHLIIITLAHMLG